MGDEDQGITSQKGLRSKQRPNMARLACKGVAQDIGGRGEGRRVVRKLLNKPVCTEDGKQETAPQSCHLQELNFLPGK